MIRMRLGGLSEVCRALKPRGDAIAPGNAMQWRKPPSTLALGTGEVHLWLALRGDGPSAPKESCDLTTDEIAAARRLRRPVDRELYVLAHVMLRDVLAHYLGLQPIEIALQTAAYGKPYLMDSQGTDLRFNLSHSKDAVLCGLTRGCEIGVDIEAMAHNDDLLNIATHFFAADEIAALAARCGDDRTTLFYRLWTRKEAYLKAHGKGLSHPLNSFSVLPNLQAVPDPVIRGLGSRSEGTWFCYGLPAPRGYAAATVLAQAASALNCWRWAPQSADAL